MPTNVGILGYGSIAREHVRAINRIAQAPGGPDLRLLGVMGRDRDSTEAFAREFGMSVATTQLDELLDDPNLDVVVITSPTDLHAEQTEKALRAGKDVLCEIPIATSLEDTDRVIHVSEETGKRLGVCHTMRYNLGLMEARRMVAEGELHVHQISSRHIRLRRENVNWKGRKRSWTDNLLWHHACHSVDAMLWLMGATVSHVTAEVALPSGPLDIPMDMTLVMRTDRDQIASVVMSYNSHFDLQDYLVMGQETSVYWEEDSLRTAEGVLVSAERETAQFESIVRQDADYFSTLLDGRELPVSARGVRPTMAVLQSVQDMLDDRLRTSGREERHPELP